MLRTLSLCVVVLALVPACNIGLNSGPSTYVYSDQLTPPGVGVVLWPADVEGAAFRYVLTSESGQLDVRGAVQEVGVPPDPDFARSLPATTASLLVLLPIDGLERLRPQAQLLIDQVTAARPRISTSVAPVEPESLEQPLLAIEDARQLNALVTRAHRMHTMQRPLNLSDAISAVLWTPRLIAMPLEGRADGGQARILLREPTHEFLEWEVIADRVVDWQGFIDALEETRERHPTLPQPALILVPTMASEGVQAEAERMLDWFDGLEGEVVAVQRAELLEEIPADADLSALCERMDLWLQDGSEAIGEVEVRVRYNSQVYGSTMDGWLMLRQGSALRENDADHDPE